MTDMHAVGNGSGDGLGQDIKSRQDWIALLARADVRELEASWEQLDDKPDYKLLRAPETGMVMVRARTGGEGRQFNFGEMSVTRCVVQLVGGRQGHAYVAGRNKTHATIAAVFDALLQDQTLRADLDKTILDPIRTRLSQRRDEDARKVAATRVDFFTMVRGED